MQEQELQARGTAEGTAATAHTTTAATSAGRAQEIADVAHALQFQVNDLSSQRDELEARKNVLEEKLEHSSRCALFTYTLLRYARSISIYEGHF